MKREGQGVRQTQLQLRAERLRRIPARSRARRVYGVAAAAYDSDDPVAYPLAYRRLVRWYEATHGRRRLVDRLFYALRSWYVALLIRASSPRAAP